MGRAGQLELKGKAEPVAAPRRAAATGTAVRTRGLEGVQARLIGRSASWRRDGRPSPGRWPVRGGILSLTGEPGIGKTRLLAELRDRSKPDGRSTAAPIWLEGRCVSYGETMPYWPFRDLLRGWIGVLADEPELRVRVALRRMVDRLFG